MGEDYKDPKVLAGLTLAVIFLIITITIIIAERFQELRMIEETKEMVDVAAASTAVLTLAAWLPPVASLFTIIWLGLRIYESDTVQQLLGKK